MAKILECAKVDPSSGCQHVVWGETEEEILTKAAEHAKEHGIREVTPELIGGGKRLCRGLCTARVPAEESPPTGGPRWLGCRCGILPWAACAVGARHGASHGEWTRPATAAALVLMAAVRTGLRQVTRREASALGALGADARGPPTGRVSWTCRPRISGPRSPPCTGRSTAPDARASPPTWIDPACCGARCGAVRIPTRAAVAWMPPRPGVAPASRPW